MSIISRVSRLLKADIHAVIDCVEEPLFIVKQALREMEAENSKTKSSLVDKERKLKELRECLESLKVQLQSAASQVDMCFKESDQKLTRVALRKRLTLEKHLGVYQRIEKELLAECSSLNQALNTQKEKIDKTKLQLKLAESVREQSFTFSHFVGCPEVESVSDDELELVFLEEQRRRANT